MQSNSYYLRYFIDLSYVGTHYHGWQKQPNASSIQQELEQALSTLLRKNVEVVGAGRTDAGVHAKQLFAHFDVEEPVDTKVLENRLNAFLPEAIAITSIKPVNSDAHARFDAESRSYQYWVSTTKNPFHQQFAHYVHTTLNVEAMNMAAEILKGYSDFECFSKTHTDVKTFLCRIDEAYWLQEDDKLVFHITADRFLRNMVRAIVGTLLEIGKEKKPVDWMHTVIQSKNRSEAEHRCRQKVYI